MCAALYAGPESSRFLAPGWGTSAEPPPLGRLCWNAKVSLRAICSGRIRLNAGVSLTLRPKKTRRSETKPNKGKHTRRQKSAKPASASAYVLPEFMTAHRTLDVRPGKLTAEVLDEFLAYYRTGMSVGMACRLIGVSTVALHERRRKDEKFATAFLDAREIGTDQIEDHLHYLAVATNNIAGIFGTLKARRPEIWREKSQLDLTNSDGSLTTFRQGMLNAAAKIEQQTRTH